MLMKPCGNSDLDLTSNILTAVQTDPQFAFKIKVTKGPQSVYLKIVRLDALILFSTSSRTDLIKACI